MQYGVYITYTCDETDLGVIASTGSIAAHSAAAARNPGSRSPARPTIHISHHLVISNDIIVSRSICRQPWRAPCNNIERVDRLNAATITTTLRAIERVKRHRSVCTVSGHRTVRGHKRQAASCLLLALPNNALRACTRILWKPHQNDRCFPRAFAHGITNTALAQFVSMTGASPED